MKPPAVISDLYGDLRDRKLLPIVVVLVVATAALPVLLGSDAEPVAPPPTDQAAETKAEVPTLPAVLASNPGLRDYRKRLDALSATNPFRQNFTLPSAADATVKDVSKSASGVTVSGGEASTSATSETGSAGGTDVSGGSGTATIDGESTEVETVNSGGEVQEFLIRHEVNVEIDGPSEDREFKGVEELETLPGKKTPLVVYAGVAADENEAVFLLSKDIVSTDGAGTCAPARDDCQLLSLPVGKQRTLFYSPDSAPSAERYVLKLHKIERIVEPLK